MTCLARARRLRGQKRVPLPPASITGANRGAFPAFHFDIRLRDEPQVRRPVQSECLLAEAGNKLADPLDAFVNYVAGHRVRKTDMLIGPKSFSGNDDHMRFAE